MKIVLAIIGIVGSTIVLSGVSIVISDIFTKLQRDWERRRQQRLEREFKDRRSKKR